MALIQFDKLLAKIHPNNRHIQSVHLALRSIVIPASLCHSVIPALLCVIPAKAGIYFFYFTTICYTIHMSALPSWLKQTYRPSDKMKSVETLLHDLELNTVCREASCPNYSECFNCGTATIMILGANCTRNCAFCGVTNSGPEPLSPEEPYRVGEAVSRLGLDYIVVTSVTRDDLPDGGAAHFAETIRRIRAQSPRTKIEVLIPDFQGDPDALAAVIDAAPDVISHNMETVRELYPRVRPQADYQRSLDLIANVSAAEGIHSKSGFMVGVGETREQITELFDDLRGAGCEFLTIGQYMRPSKQNLEVAEYVTPEAFEELGEIARAKGFSFVASAPFVRSSYHAGEALR
ncbi:MAG: lipoyl synthase [Clostridiales Family XIII bacterium]|jgi:lipoic acid synthetase|nr:lipoyl synthase [Clostridiales Family XIII bacterium]